MNTGGTQVFHETLLTVHAVLPFHSNQRVWDQEPIPNLQLPRRRCIQCSRTYVYKTIAYSILIHGIVYLFILRRSQNDQERSCINEIKELVLTLYQGGRGCVSLFGREVGLLHLASYLKDYLETDLISSLAQRMSTCNAGLPVSQWSVHCFHQIPTVVSVSFVALAVLSLLQSWTMQRERCVCVCACGACVCVHVYVWLCMKCACVWVCVCQSGECVLACVCSACACVQRVVCVCSVLCVYSVCSRMGVSVCVCACGACVCVHVYVWLHMKCACVWVCVYVRVVNVY